VFWTAFVCFTTVVGIAVHGPPAPAGAAQVCLQPLTLIGMTFLAANFWSIAHPARILLTLSIAAGVLPGIILQVRIEMLAIRAVDAGTVDILTLCDGLLNAQAVSNSISRFRRSDVFLSDFFMQFDWAILIIVIAMFGAVLLFIANAAVTGNEAIRFKPRRFACIVLAAYAIAAVACVSDRYAGYAIETAATQTAPTTQELRTLLDQSERAVQLNPESADANYDLAVANYRLGEVKTAALPLFDALLLDPEHRKTRYLLHLYISLHDLQLKNEDVITHVYYRAYRQDCDHLTYYGEQLFLHDFKQTASKALGDAVRLYPNNAKAHQDLAVVFFSLGNHPQAIIECEKTLRIDPTSIEAERALRAMLSLRGDEPAAIDRRIQELKTGK
jgi:tetratricopeptide (TPR) repeat protein